MLGFFSDSEKPMSCLFCHMINRIWHSLSFHKVLSNSFKKWVIKELATGWSWHILYTKLSRIYKDPPRKTFTYVKPFIKYSEKRYIIKPTFTLADVSLYSYSNRSLISLEALLDEFNIMIYWPLLIYILAVPRENQHYGLSVMYRPRSACAVCAC